MTEATTLVRYVRNADDTRATAAIKHHDDDRPDLVLGGVGYVSYEELVAASSFGVVLEEITEEEVRNLGLELPDQLDEDKPLEDLSKAELEEIAAAEDVDLSGARSNADKAARIQEARAARSQPPEGEAGLPATATLTTTSGPAT